jgi:acetyl-CoA carboxylase alpha subunit
MAINAVGDAIAAALEEFWGMPPAELRASRSAKFLNIGRKI